MKGFVFDIRRYAVHDGPGIRTTVFMKGCPLRCFWCHNPESWKLENDTIRKKRSLDGLDQWHDEPIGRHLTTQEVMTQLLRDRIFYEESNGGVTFSGGEPLMQPQFLLQMLSLCKSEEIHTAVDTSGFATHEVFSRVASATNMLLFDLKAIDESVHEEATGQKNRLILQNLRSLHHPSLKLIIRIPLIPGVNNDKRSLKAFVDFLKTIRQPIEQIDILPFHRLGQHKYEALGLHPSLKLPNHDATNNTLEALTIFSDAGFRVKEGG